MLKVGVVGFSGMARNNMIPAIIKSKLFQLTSISTSNVDNVTSYLEDQEIKDVEVYKGYDSLFIPDNLDVVYISLPNNMHYEYAKKALLNGIHVLVEKPVTPHYEESIELIHIANQNGLLLKENFQFEYHKQFTVLKQYVDSAEYGEIKYIRTAFCFPEFKDKSNIRYQNSLDGGAVLDAGCYPLKIASLLFDEELEVLSSFLSYSESFKVDLSGFGTLITKKSKIPVQLYFGFDNFYQNSITIHFKNGRISLDRVFTAKSNYSVKLSISDKNNSKEIEIGTDDHFANSLEAIFNMIETKSYDKENNKTLRQVKLLNSFISNAKSKYTYG